MVDLRRLAFDKSLNQNALGEILQLPQPEVSKLMNGRRDVTQAHLDLLSEHFGADVIAHYIIDNATMEEFRLSHARQVEATIIPADIVEEVKAEVMEAESVPMLTEELSCRTDFDVRAYIEENGDELERINPSQLLKRADLAEKILKTSMLPTFVPGDIVFVRFIQDKAKIIDGDTYYLDTKSRPTMIRKVKFEPNNKIRLVAQNLDFADIIIDKSDIISVAKIIGLLRLTFSDCYADIEAVRRRKDEQIDNLIAQIDKAGERESRLITLLENNK